jgi:hypothetical protein
MTIIYSFLASVFVLPTFLVFWAKWKKRKGGIISGDIKKEPVEEIHDEHDQENIPEEQKQIDNESLSKDNGGKDSEEQSPKEIPIESPPDPI